MPNILVVHSRKGGAGKTTLAYELAWMLDAVLVDLEWEGGSASRTWGYRWEDRLRAPLLTAIARGTTPRPLKGFRKPRLVPGHPEFANQQPAADDMADLLSKWAGEWGDEWVVVDTHPGATEATNGALAVANVVVVPVALATKDLDGTEALITELADYPIVLVPNKVPAVPPAAELRRLRRMTEKTPVDVAPIIPQANAVTTRKKRMAITSEDPTPKAMSSITAALNDIADYVTRYVKENDHA
jgi:chromosome partitioning protein